MPLRVTCCLLLESHSATADCTTAAVTSSKMEKPPLKQPVPCTFTATMPHQLHTVVVTRMQPICTPRASQHAAEKTMGPSLPMLLPPLSFGQHKWKLSVVLESSTVNQILLS